MHIYNLIYINRNENKSLQYQSNIDFEILLEHFKKVQKAQRTLRIQQRRNIILPEET